MLKHTLLFPIFATMMMVSCLSFAEESLFDKQKSQAFAQKYL